MNTTPHCRLPRSKARTAILYGSPGTDCFPAFHSALQAAARDTSRPAPLTYALRPVLLAACMGSAHPCALVGADRGRLQLPGFGVEMAIKNMEYSALDDSKVSELATVCLIVHHFPETLQGPPESVLQPTPVQSCGSLSSSRTSCLSHSCGDPFHGRVLQLPSS